MDYKEELSKLVETIESTVWPSGEKSEIIIDSYSELLPITQKMLKVTQMYHLTFNAADEIIANLGEGYETLPQERKEFLLIVTFNMMGDFLISLLGGDETQKYIGFKNGKQEFPANSLITDSLKAPLYSYEDCKMILRALDHILDYDEVADLKMYCVYASALTVIYMERIHPSDARDEDITCFPNVMESLYHVHALCDHKELEDE